MTSEEWGELFQHLLAGLDKSGMGEVRAAIEMAASEPVVEDGTPEMVRREVGKATTRPRTASERFAAAVDVLHSRLVELPSIVASTSLYLGKPPEQVVFRYDTYESTAPSPALVQSQDISLSRMYIKKDDQVRIFEILTRLGATDVWVRHE